MGDSEYESTGGKKHKRRTNKRRHKRGGSILNRAILPATLLIGQKTLQSRKRRGKKMKKRTKKYKRRM